MSEEEGAKARTKREGPPRVQTCDTCRLRHQKCNGARPCYHCELRGITCNYTNIPTSKAKSRKISKSSASEKQLARETNHNDLFVQTIIAEELARLKLPSELQQDVTERLSKRLSRRAAPLRTITQSDLKKDPTATASPQYLVYLLAEHLCQRTGHSFDNFRERLHISHDLALPLALPLLEMEAMSQTSIMTMVGLPSKEQAIIWLRTLMMGPNLLLNIVNEGESDHMLEKLYENQDMTPKETCIIHFCLAVGARFTEGVPDHIHCQLYDRARAQMESAIESNTSSSLWSIQPLLLSCVYMMTGRPRLCQMLLGTIIQIAQANRLDTSFDVCPFLDEDEYERWRNAWKAVYFLDLWTSIHLAQLPQLNEYTTRDPFLQGILKGTIKPSSSLPSNIAFLSVLYGNILREIHASDDVSWNTYEKHLQTLAAWPSSLPAAVKFGERQASDGGPQTYIASLYLEMFYLLGNILLSLPLIRHTFEMEEEQAFPPWTIRSLAQSCYDSAIQIANITSRLIPEEMSCMRFWAPNTMNFYSALVLLLGLVNRESTKTYNLKSAQTEMLRKAMQEGLDQAVNNIQESSKKSSHARVLFDIIQTLQALKGSLLVVSVSPSESSGVDSPLVVSPGFDGLMGPGRRSFHAEPVTTESYIQGQQAYPSNLASASTLSTDPSLQSAGFPPPSPHAAVPFNTNPFDSSTYSSYGAWPASISQQLPLTQTIFSPDLPDAPGIDWSYISPPLYSGAMPQQRSESMPSQYPFSSPTVHNPYRSSGLSFDFSANTSQGAVSQGQSSAPSPKSK